MCCQYNVHHFLERYIPNKPQSLESSLHAWFIALSVNLEHALDFKGQRMCNNCNNILFQVNWYINCLGAVFKISAALIYTSVYAYRVRVCVSVFISCVILFWKQIDKKRNFSDIYISLSACVCVRVCVCVCFLVCNY